jgi:hypothetical protein
MSTLTITRNYSDDETYTEAIVDAQNDSIESWANGNIGATNIASGGVEAGNLASNAVTTVKIAADAVTTAKIADSNVTTAKIADSNVTTAKIADLNVTTAKINDLAVTTAKINDGAVTQAKRAALGQQVSSSSGNFSVSGSTSYTDVTNLSVTLTTTGRPVMLVLVPDAAGGTSSTIGNAGSSYAGYIKFLRDATSLGELTYQQATYNSGQTPVIVDVPSAGTYTYKVQAKTNSALGGNFMGVRYMILVAFEL